MFKKLFLIFSFMAICSYVHADPIVSSVSGTISEDEILNITGSGFGSHADYSEGTYTGGLCAKYKDFDDDSLTSGGWTVTVGRVEGWDLTTSGARIVNNTCAQRHYAKDIVYGRLCGLYYIMTQAERGDSTGLLYTSFWFKTTAPEYDSVVGSYVSGKSLMVETLEDISYGIFTTTLDNNYYLRGSSFYCDDPAERVQWTSVDTFEPGKWYFIEQVIKDFPHPNDSVRTYINGKLQWDRNDYMMRTESLNRQFFYNSGGYPYEIGFMIGYGDGKSSYYAYDDIYVDYTLARVVIGDNPIFDNCRHREMQIPLSWDTDTISVKVNTGSFQPGDIVYLFVVSVDENETEYISPGYQLAIAGGTPQVAARANVNIGVGAGARKIRVSTSSGNQKMRIQ